MVAVKSAEADRFIARPPAGVFLFLFHGLDTGLIHERARAVAKAGAESSADLLRIDGDELAKDPLRLLDEVNTVGMFSTRRAVWVDLGSKNILPVIQTMMDAPPADCIVVIEAGNLKKGTPLRTLAEQSSRAASVECYADEARDLDRLVDAEAQAAGLTVDNAARSALRDLLGGDRMTSRAELAKLMLYAHGKGRVTLDDVEAIVTDTASIAADPAVDAAFLGKREDVEDMARRAFADGLDPAAVLASALRHAYALHRTRLDIERGKGRMEAIGAGARAIHFKRKGAFETQVQRLKADHLAEAIATLSEAVMRSRQEPRLAEMIAVRALWNVASKKA